MMHIVLEKLVGCSPLKKTAISKIFLPPLHALETEADVSLLPKIGKITVRAFKMNTKPSSASGVDPRRGGNLVSSGTRSGDVLLAV